MTGKKTRRTSANPLVAIAGGALGMIEPTPIGGFQWIGPTEFRRRLGVCRPTFEKMLREGQLPAPEVFGPKTRRWLVPVVERYGVERQSGRLKVVANNKTVKKRRRSADNEGAAVARAERRSA